MSRCARQTSSSAAGLTAAAGVAFIRIRHGPLHGTVIPPVPHRLRLDVRLQRRDRPRLIEATID